MAAAAACRRVGQLGSSSVIALARSGGFGAIKVPSLLETSICDPFSAFISRTRQPECRHISQLVGERLFLVDTLALVRKLEGQGVSSKQAEAITAAIVEVLNNSQENISESFVSKGEMQKIEMIREANFSKFKSEVPSSQGYSLLRHQIEKLGNDVEKMCSRDDMEKMCSELRHKMDIENQIIRAQLEGAKYDIIKYCIGTFVSISAVSLAVCILM